MADDFSLEKFFGLGPVPEESPVLQWLKKQINQEHGPTGGALHNEPQAPGPASTIYQALTNPGGVLKGVGQGIAGGVRGVTQSGLNVLQALSPVPIPGATDEFKRGDPNSYFDLPNAAYRASRIANAAEFGAPDAIKARADAELKKKGLTLANATTEQKWDAGLTGAAKALGMDLLPGKEVVQALTGRTETGVDEQGNTTYRPTTAEDLGQSLITGPIKLSVADQIAKGLGVPGGLGVHAALGEENPAGLGPSDATVRKTISMGEVRQAQNSLKATNEFNAGVTGNVEGTPTINPVEPTALGEPPPAPGVAAGRITQEAHDLIQQTISPETAEANRQRTLLSSPQIAAVQARLAQSNILHDVLTSAAKEGGIRQNELVARVIEQGGLPELGNIATQLAERHGVTVEEASKLLANEVRESSTEAGRYEAALSHGKDLMEAELLHQANAGDPAAARSLQALRRVSKADPPYMGLWQKASLASNKLVERTRLGALVMTLPNTVRNTISHLGNVQVMNIFDAAATGIAESITGHLNNDGRPAGEYFGDLAGIGHGLYDTLSPAGREVFKEIQKNLPLNTDMLNGVAGPLALDARLNVIENLNPKRNSTGIEKLDGLIGLGNILNSSQTILARHLSFRTRLEANLKGIGKSLDDLRAEVDPSSGEFPQNSKMAVAEATEHALKQTFSYLPSESPVAKIITVMKNYVPFATALTVPFPRFMVNALRYNMERSPALFFDLFDKDFRDKLYAGVEGGLETKMAHRQLGKAVEGFFNLNMAYNIRANPALAGNKWWEIRTGDKDADGNDRIRDMSGYHPYAAWLGLGEVMHRYTTGQGFDGMPINDFLRMVAGIRQLGNDVPITGLADLVSAENSSDPDKFENMLKKGVGGYIATFLHSVQQVQAVYGNGLNVPTGPPAAVGGTPVSQPSRTAQLVSPHPEVLYHRDIKNDPLTGPVRTITNPSAEPIRYSPYNGKPEVTTDKPLKRLVTGVPEIGKSRLQSLIEELPGASINQLIGASTRDATANEAIRRNFGILVNKKGANGETVANTIAKTLQDANLTPEARHFMLAKILDPVAKVARNVAKIQVPLPSIEEDIEKRLPFLKKTLEREFNKRQPSSASSTTP
jgi:hypothetical protein